MTRVQRDFEAASGFSGSSEEAAAAPRIWESTAVSREQQAQEKR